APSSTTGQLKGSGHGPEVAYSASSADMYIRHLNEATAGSGKKPDAFDMLGLMLGFQGGSCACQRENAVSMLASRMGRRDN
ncbi:unnamed protein product, partial [Chrysoparadoxa australica]